MDGAEKHFQNRKTLHTFREAPAGAIFALFFDHAEKAELVLKVPAGVRISEAFSSNHNVPDRRFPVKETKKGEFHITGLRTGKLFREFVTCMIEIPEGCSGGKVE